MSGPRELATEIEAARRRLLEFLRACPDVQWHARPLAQGDPRSVAVIVDHVAHAYEYIGSWLEQITAGRTVAVDAAVVDALNADHAASVTAPSPAAVETHLMESGDRLMALVSGLRPEQLALEGGRAARLAEIAARHADGHRVELEEALRPPG